MLDGRLLVFLVATACAVVACASENPASAPRDEPSASAPSPAATQTPMVSATSAPLASSAPAAPSSAPSAIASSAPAAARDASVVFDYGAQPRSLHDDERTKLLDIALKWGPKKHVTLLVQSSSQANAKAWGKLLRDYLVSGGIQEQALVVTPCVANGAPVRSTLVDGAAGCDAVAK